MNTGIILGTEEDCTTSGYWELVGAKKDSIFIQKGQMMPSYDGKPVNWRLARASEKE